MESNAQDQEQWPFENADIVNLYPVELSEKEQVTLLPQSLN